MQHMRILSMAMLAFAIPLLGCSDTGIRSPSTPGDAAAGNVEGKMLHTPETFTGDATGQIDGSGQIALVSSQGTRCDGPYRQVADDRSAEVNAEKTHSGVATLTCNDGRKGSVMFTVGADQAVGTGMLGTDIVTLQIAQ